jgi:hypothetical protein
MRRATHKLAFASIAFRNSNANGLATAPNRVQETSGSQSGRFRVRASLDGSKHERP